MAQGSDDQPNRNAAGATLAELVARKAAARASRPVAGGRALPSERDAAARSAAKSKPARRY